MKKKNLNPKLKNKEVAKIPLSEYYENLPNATRKVIAHSPKENFLKELSQLTGRTPDTVRSWCLGNNIPAMHIQEKIAGYLKVDVDNLFPNAE